MKLLPLLFLLSGMVANASNLVQDPCFEAGPRPWFAENGGGRYFLAREKVGGARQGQWVLAVEGWGSQGATLLSPPFPLTESAYGFTTAVRFSGPQPVTLECALFDETGTRRLASLASETLGVEPGWKVLKAANVPRTGGATVGRLGLVVTGPSKGARLEFDEMGLFPGGATEPVRDRSETQTFEAATFAGGAGWRSVENLSVTKVNDIPLAERALSGTHAAGEEAETRRTISVREGGACRLWVRFLHSSSPGEFTFGVWQHGQAVAQKTILPDDKRYGDKGTHWAWDCVEATLAPGEAEIFFARPAEASKPFTRLIDLVVLTNLTDYQPSHIDYRPAGYVRYLNLSEEQAPYCLYVSLRRPIYRMHEWFRVPGILSHAGFSGERSVSKDPMQWLAPGEASPWVRLSDDLLPGEGGNRVQWIATRGNRGTGLVSGGIKGRLEFAAGEDRQVVKTILIDQEAPRFMTTLPDDFASHRDEILTGFDYVEGGRKALGEGGDAPGEPLRNIEVQANLRLSTALDDPKLIAAEIDLLRRLGFNNTLPSLAPPSGAIEFNRRMGLVPAFTITAANPFSLLSGKCQSALDPGTMEEVIRKTAQKNAPLFAAPLRNLMEDEPSAMTYRHIVECPDCARKFRESLMAEKLEPGDLGVPSWEAVRPIPPEERARFPHLFYRTALFRLKSLARLLEAANKTTHRYYPKGTLGFVNISPVNAGTWTDGLGDHGGVDPFLVLRGDPSDLVWTEDWGNNGASPQQTAALLSLFRSAGRDKPLGGYCVIVNADPVLIRLKAMQWLAAGARYLNFYLYGPTYADVGSWGGRYAIYPAVASVGREIRALDSALEGVVQRKSPIAILYNRTAGIWRDFAVPTEHDSRYLHWALAHEGYEAGFVSEEDIEAGALEGIRVLYLDGVQLRAATAEKVARWVSGGGIVAATAGAGTRNEFNEPMATLDAVFGLKSRGLAQRGDPGRPMFETRTLPVLDRLESAGTTAPPVSFNRLSLTEELLPGPGAEVFLKTGDGKPAGVLHPYGKGKAIRLAALPGLAYLNDAIRGADYDPSKAWFPRKYRGELARFIAWPARLAGVGPIAEKSAPMATVTRWDHPDRSILYVIDYSAEPKADFRMILPDAGGFLKARSIRGTPVKMERLPGGKVRLEFRLDVTDAILLER